MSSDGISIPDGRDEVVKQYPLPKTPKELKRFLGTCAFIHRCVRHASNNNMAPLTKLKNISRQKEFDDAWLPIHDRAFVSVKDAIANATLLLHALVRCFEHSRKVGCGSH